MIDKLREKLGEEVLENEPLANHCTFKIGGLARYFFVAKDAEKIINATKVAMKLGIKVFVFSGGSNVLFSDDGFDGLVIKVASNKYKVTSDGVIETDAGVAFATVVDAAMEHGLTGLEWAAGIPGTVGGAVRGNAGAHGHAIGEAVEEVEAIKVSSFPDFIEDPRWQSHRDKFSAKGGSAPGGQVSSYGKEECGFGYRESIFKREGGIILKVVLKLEPGDKKKIKEEMEKIFKARDGKIPTEPSAGSFMKNIEVTDEIVKTIKEHIHEGVPTDYIIKGKIPAAWLIEQCDLKDKQIGGAKISEKHANFIVNTGGATAGDVIALASLVKMKVRDEIGVQLQEEIEYVGF